MFDALFIILYNLRMDKKSKKSSGLSGEIVIPADKSISHRAAIFSLLCDNPIKITNFSKGEDCRSSLNIISKLGAKVEYLSSQELIITPPKVIQPPKEVLYCGNSGTTMRLMSGLLAAQSFNSILTGDESLSKRPMKRIITPISQMGGKIESNDFKAPLKIYGQKLRGINYNSPLASAQVKSCILLAGLFAQGKTTVTEPYLSRNHSELMLKYLGADISTEKTTVKINPSKLISKDIEITGDISSAAFFLAAGAIIPNSKIKIKNVGLNPTRTGIIDVLIKMGANLNIENERTLSGEKVGDLVISTSKLKGITIEGEIIPKLIDEIPVIAVLATQAKGETIIKDAQDLRNKESDRIKVVADGLKSIGADIRETPDGMIIKGKTPLNGNVEIESFHDHRIAMSFYIAGLICKNPITIKGFEWVNISFPEFEGLIEKLKT